MRRPGLILVLGIVFTSLLAAGQAPAGPENGCVLHPTDQTWVSCSYTAEGPGYWSSVGKGLDCTIAINRDGNFVPVNPSSSCTPPALFSPGVLIPLSDGGFVPSIAGDLIVVHAKLASHPTLYPNGDFGVVRVSDNP